MRSFLGDPVSICLNLPLSRGMLARGSNRKASRFGWYKTEKSWLVPRGVYTLAPTWSTLAKEVFADDHCRRSSDQTG